MRMNEILNTRLFALLSDTSQEVTTDEMRRAYGEFTTHVEVISSENDNATIFRMLNNIRIELAALKPFYRYEQGGKCPEKSVSAKSHLVSRIRNRVTKTHLSAN
jgi:hypothetical protein